jgi:hypothetical protein
MKPQDFLNVSGKRIIREFTPGKYYSDMHSFYFKKYAVVLKHINGRTFEYVCGYDGYTKENATVTFPFMPYLCLVKRKRRK